MEIEYFLGPHSITYPLMDISKKLLAKLSFFKSLQKAMIIFFLFSLLQRELPNVEDVQVPLSSVSDKPTHDMTGCQKCKLKVSK